MKLTPRMKGRLIAHVLERSIREGYNHEKRKSKPSGPPNAYAAQKQLMGLE